MRMVTRILGIIGAFVCYFVLMTTGLTVTQHWLIAAVIIFIAVANWERK